MVGMVVVLEQEAINGLSDGSEFSSSIGWGKAGQSRAEERRGSGGPGAGRG